MARSSAPTPDHVLCLAAAVCFSSVAAVAMHFYCVAFMSGAAFHLGVGVTALLTIPVVLVSLRAARAGRGIAEAIAVAAVGGVVVSLVVSATLAASRPYAQFSFLGFSAKSSNPAWLVMAIPLGALPGAAAGVLLAVLLRLLQRAAAHATQDGRERVAARLLTLAGAVAAVACWVVGPRELATTLLATAAALVCLGVVVARDVRRLAFVRRVFSGKSERLALHPAALEGEALPLVALAVPSAAIVATSARDHYRQSARGEAVALVGETLEETSAPLRRRVTWTVAGIVAIAAVAGAALASAQALALSTTAVAFP
jgi:hypothetical protein